MTAFAAVFHATPTRPSRQRGQSLVELVVLCAVLVPMFLLVPILGKYIHIKQQTQQAARSSAWEATVSHDYRIPALANTHSLMIDRHYAAADAPIRTLASGNGNARLGDELLNTFSNQPLLERGDIRMGAYQNQRSAGLMDRISGVLSKLPGNFPPNDKGLVTSHMDVSIQDIRLANGAAASFLEPFDAIGLRLKSSNTVLADAWNAAGAGAGKRPGPRTVLAQVRNLTPTSYLSGAGSVLDSLDVLPMFGVLARLDPGYIAPDVVPIDKLERYAPRN